MKNAIWLQAQKGKSYPSVEQDMSVHTLIVGAGLTGLTTAYYLSNIANDFIIIEADEIGYGASGRNTGKLSAQHGLVYGQLIHDIGEDKAMQYYEAQMDAIASVEEIIEQHQIQCDFKRCSSMVFTQSQDKIADVQDEYQSCLDLGIPCTYVEECNYPISIRGGIRFFNQAKYNPYAYLLGLSDILDERGIQIFEHTPMINLEKGEHGYVVKLQRSVIHAQKIVFASQFPFIDYGHFYFAKMYAQQSSLLAFPCDFALPEDMLINADEPLQSYNMITLDNQKYVLCGGNKHKAGQGSMEDETAFINAMRQLFRFQETSAHWTSQDYVTFDKLPLIGPLDQDDHLYFASGYQKWGNTFANVAGKLLCAHLLKQPSVYEELFHPKRFANVFNLQFLKENMNVAYEYISGKMKQAENIYPRRNHATTIELANHMYGMYRDEADELFIVDITCPHLGCILSFNDVDKTWDCPCHGSRYDVRGAVIKGPTTHGLHVYETKQNEIHPHILKHKENSDD